MRQAAGAFGQGAITQGHPAVKKPSFYSFLRARRRTFTTVGCRRVSQRTSPAASTRLGGDHGLG